MKQGIMRSILQGSFALISCTSLSACGGWGGEWDWDFSDQLPPPPQEPAGDAVIADVAEAGPGSNTDRVIWSQALEDEEATGPLSFRLVQSVRNTNFAQPAQVQNVTAITDAGATITTVIPDDPDGDVEVLFTIKDPQMGIQDVVLEEDPNAPQLTATLPDGRVVRVTLDQTDRSSDAVDGELSWVAYGAWNVSGTGNTSQTATYYVTGAETPDGNMPTSGTATFDGFVIGNVALPDGQNIKAASLQGDASMTVDFASGAITGGAPNITATPLGTVMPGTAPTVGPAEAWNGLTFAGSMTAGINAFSGTTAVSSAPGNAYSLSSEAAGFFSGLFYGPNANELGAVWNLSDGVGAASGVLVGKQ